MKLLTVFLMIAFAPAANWTGDFSAAKQEAAQKHELILINFCGSDWCGNCIRLRKDIFESEVFENYAAQHLILVRADFPREKKNQPSKEQIKRNDALADKYNANGEFPFTVLVDQTGKVIKSWDGYPNETAAQFVDDINTAATDQ